MQPKQSSHFPAAGRPISWAVGVEAYASQFYGVMTPNASEMSSFDKRKPSGSLSLI